MQLEQQQIQALESLLDDAQAVIGASLYKNAPAILLKAINDEIRAEGLDEQYDLNAKGEKLQALYEQIYKANEDLLS